MMPKPGDVLESAQHPEISVRVVVITEPVEITEADTVEGWPGDYGMVTHHAAAREAQDSPRRMPEWWDGRIRLPGVWRIVGRE